MFQQFSLTDELLSRLMQDQMNRDFEENMFQLVSERHTRRQVCAMSC